MPANLKVRSRMLRSSVNRALAAVGTAAMLTAGLASPSLGEAHARSATSSAVLHVQIASVANTTFAYAELGTGPPLLLLNGTGSPMNEWDPVLLGQLSTSHRVIVFDYPGLGLSGPAPSVWRFSDAADWIAEFARVVSPNAPVDLMGWSMGGFISQQFAIRHPEQVRKLVLAGTNAGGPMAILGPEWVQALDSEPQGGDHAYLRTNYPHSRAAQSAGRSFLDRLARAVDSGAYPVERVPNATHQAMVAAEDPWLRSNANLRALKAVRVAALVITGIFDVVTPAENSRLIARRMPAAQLVLVPGAGHSFLFQNPVSTARTVNQFLAVPRIVE